MTSIHRSSAKRVTAALATAVAVASAAAIGLAGTAVAAPAAEFKICTFTDVDYAGGGSCVGFDQGILEAGQSQLLVLADGTNDQMSSIQLQDGYGVRLYEDAGLQGAFIDLTADAPNLVDLDFNDKVSSLLLFSTK